MVIYMKTAVIYWSSTGNTEAMANAVAAGAAEAGAEVFLFTASEFGSGMLGDYDSIALGCPSMGVEELEDSEFRPMFDDIKNSLAGKKVALFGSYGWGDGEWMRSWEERCGEIGAVLAAESVICNDAPDDTAVESCKALGAALV